MTYRKKLIEVALPLEAINMESAREKSIRHGHPSTLHLWWARRPLAACRAVLWASLVDDPSSWPDRFPTEEDQTQERQRLFDILGRIVVDTDKKGKQKQKVRGLVSWDDIKEPQIIDEAQREIARCLAWGRGETPPTTPEAVREYIAHHAPPAYDPFAGGGSIPLEAQRLGLEAHASDLNPVAVLINKALIEIPPKFANLAPVNGEDRPRVSLESWRGAQGLAADVRYYGAWMREQALQRIGHLYPPVELEDGDKATVIAWLWARTVKCPNPACGCQMPLVRSFKLSTKKDKEAWVKPIVEAGAEHQPPGETPAEAEVPRIRFQVQSGRGDVPEGTVSRKGAVCLACGTPVGLDYVRSEGREGRMGAQLMAIVAEGDKGRTYVSPTDEQEQIANSAQPKWKPETELVNNSRHMTPVIYGMTKHADLFTSRQLVALTTFSDLVSEAKDKAIQEALAAGLSDDNIPLNDGGTGARAYGEAISVYLAFAVDKSSDYWSNLCTWHTSGEKMSHVFTRQAIPMTWDFAEANPMSDSSGNFMSAITWARKVLEGSSCNAESFSLQHNAMEDHTNDLRHKVVSMDPPYYDAVPYADLSDFFYTWLRPGLSSIYSDICRTLLVPKSEEMVADSFRHGSKQKARDFFESSLIKVFHRINNLNHHDYPVTVYYALKQTETDNNENVASTGWETILEGLMQSNFSICGTWPLRTELSNRMRGQASNALASSIVLVCRPRPENAPKTSRRQFLKELKRELPTALKTLQQGNIAPVDLAQASIGPGMAVYSQYSAVLENDGSPLTVRTALQLINQLLDEYLTEQEGEFDSDTRWALTWFEQYQFNSGPYGEAETLSTARNTSVQGLEEAGILTAKAGKVRLVKREELPEHWTPQTDNRIPHWELTQHLIQRLLQNGELGAAELLAALKGEAAEVEIARDLAYRLYNLCDRKGWSSEAIAYNSLVISWPEINRLSSECEAAPQQGQLF
ncbi:MAG: putative DNA methylase [Phormidium sp. OSCR]|nr:MAG: putative DNA methylase [Phormidium sp. OSCR]